MKLVMAVVQDADVARLIQALVEKEHRATKLASTGGFLRQGNTTLLVGVEDLQVDDVMAIIRENCHTREQTMTGVTPFRGTAQLTNMRLKAGGAIVFVLGVVSFERV